MIIAASLLASALPAMSKEKVHRLDMGKKFIPKGYTMMGLSGGYSSNSGDDLNIFVLNDINFGTYSISASPFVGVFVTDDFAVGARFNYKRTMLGLGGLDLNLSDDMQFSLKDINYISQKYQSYIFGRYYMGLGKSKIFALFAEARLGYTYTESKNTTGVGADMSGSYQTRNTVGLYINPGLCAFVNDFVSVEASVGILGVDYTWLNQITNQVDKAKYSALGAKFQINLLAINIGVTFVF